MREGALQRAREIDREQGERAQRERGRQSRE